MLRYLILQVNIIGANRHPRMVKQPNEFLPERFDPQAETKVPTYSYLPFSLGPRNCIGQVFAQVCLYSDSTHFGFYCSTACLTEVFWIILGQRDSVIAGWGRSEIAEWRRSEIAGWGRSEMAG